jgi:AcrR family transcriptional regulator
MSRTAGNADRLLIDAAKKIISREGCSGLRIRDVATRAGVNLGMFHYHFRSKKRFTRVLLQEMYEDFFSQLTVASREGKNSITQLRSTLFVMARFIRDHREFYAALIKDILNGDPEVLQFVSTNVPRHAAVIGDLLERCQRDGILMPLPFSQAMSFIMSGLNFPIVISGIVEASSKRTAAATSYVSGVVSDQAIEQRLDMILKGMKA